MPANNFNKNVFINCPFDKDYKDILLGIIFTTNYLGFIPRLAFERSDCAEPRINKIKELIVESKFGIHDLSRIVSKEKEEHFRMNMPFELGIDYGCKNFKGDIWSTKKILILEKEKYRYQKALSDLSGSDIKHHHNKVIEAIIAVRDWFVTEELNHGDSGHKIWANYNDFQAFLYDKVVVEDGHKKVSEVPITEVSFHMKSWFEY